MGFNILMVGQEISLHRVGCYCGDYLTASQTSIAQIQSRIKARRYAAKLVVLVKLLLGLKDAARVQGFISRNFCGKKFILADLKK